MKILNQNSPSFLKMILCGFLLIISMQSIAQDVNDDIAQQQRVLFVFNAAQQIVWDDISSKSSFTIGVVGNDPVLVDFTEISRQRKILGKSVKIKAIRIGDLSLYGVDILYANKDFYFDEGALLRSCVQKNILFISENYQYNRSMINIVRYENSYKYDINERNMQAAGLSASSSLRLGAVKSSEKWIKLYQKTEKELSEVEEQNENQKEINENQKEIIEKQLEVIDTKEEVITSKDRSIRTLRDRSENMSKKLTEQLDLEEALEKRIRLQIDQIDKQSARMDSIDYQVEVQQAILVQKTEEIQEKERILEDKVQVIKSQKILNFLLISLLGLGLIFVIIIFLGLIKNKKLNRQLKKQQSAIVEQSVLLEEKNKELEQFAYITSHDLQEPLGSISAFIDVLEDDYGEKFDEDGKTILGFIKEGSVRMSKLIEALLQYSRLGRNRDYKEVNCNGVLDNLKLDLSAVIKKNQASIIVSDLPTVYGNEIELGLLFQNLIGNAIKFKTTYTNPIVHVKAKEVIIDAKKYHQFAITDNGIGMKKEHLERIFGIFQRLNSRDNYKGSGIGLAHCEKIVKSHNGNIWVTSEEGKGSTFHFTIPINKHIIESPKND